MLAFIVLDKNIVKIQILDMLGIQMVISLLTLICSILLSTASVPNYLLFIYNVYRLWWTQVGPNTTVSASEAGQVSQPVQTKQAGAGGPAWADCTSITFNGLMKYWESTKFWKKIFVIRYWKKCWHIHVVLKSPIYLADNKVGTLDST
jgi:hypothetical protein